jgi:LysR family glycine cleavage system transcriptional activator
MRLPPLKSIRVFEVAARLGSFTLAAEELNVTHGAVSRQVAILEEWLGTSLFTRLNRRVVLTAEGRTLLAEVEPAFNRIALAAASLAVNRKMTTLAVNAPPTFTMRWLIPRLPKFFREHDAIDVHLTTSIRPVDFASGTYDVAIRRGSDTHKDLHTRVFLPEVLVPVCSNALYQRVKLKTPSDLARQVLIHTETAPMAWPDWLRSAGVTGQPADRSLRFEEMFYAVEAATNGLGIALAPAALVADDIFAKRLVMPFPVPSSRQHDYRVLYPKRSKKQAAIENFSAWLVHEGQQSVASLDRLFQPPPGVDKDASSGHVKNRRRARPKAALN